jgi:CelD/BcsL family acetyltransferase involved in cellulose biosynthesis
MPELLVESFTGGPEVLDQVSDEWTRLLEAGDGGSFYWRPEWISAFLRANSPQTSVLLYVVKRASRICGLLPFIQVNRRFAGLPARRLIAPLTTVGATVDLAANPPELIETVEALWRSLRADRIWDVLELPSVLESAALNQLVAAARNDGYFTGSWKQPVIAYFTIPQGDNAKSVLHKYPRHPKLRSKVRQKEAKLMALGNVRLVRTDTNSAEKLQCFYQMEAAGWKGREGSAIISDPRSQKFFDEVVHQAEKSGNLCLYTLELDRKPIAAHIGFTYRGRYWAVKSTYDEQYRDYAPGHLIVKAILQDCSERGVGEYVMGIREDWKMEWTEHVRTRTYQCIFNRGTWPALLYALRFPVRRGLAQIGLLKRALQRQT